MMNCPICTGQELSEEVSVIEKIGTKVIVQGIIKAVINHPDRVHYPPFADYYTVVLYPPKGGAKYLKFETMEDMSKWQFEKEKRIKCEGCMHTVDGWDLIFNISEVRYLT